MSLRLETESRKAFELVASAVEQIESFQQKREPNELVAAQQILVAALAEDPKYVDAVYFSGMVSELSGRSVDAIPQFKQVLKARPSFVDQVEYNLGVAYYHLYSPVYLNHAITHFDRVIEQSGDSVLRILARAGLVQTYGMKVRLKHDPALEFTEAKRNFDFCIEQSPLIQQDIAKLKNAPPLMINEAKWTICNAQAIARMFFSDYKIHAADLDERINLLKETLVLLSQADELKRKNWAVRCNFGSTHMRLGDAYKAKKLPDEAAKEFGQAVTDLEQVVNSLRPNYGFALYEIGRVHRLNKSFENAKVFFNAALKIDSTIRNVHEETVRKELARAESGDEKFP
jgi:tetratricopeptide (TPR) repeat protein